MVRFLDLYSQYLGIQSEIDAAIAAVISESAYIGGQAVKTFEANFAAYQEAAYCVGVGNGTDALEIALEALALPANSEIIVPANSFIASSESVTRTGHRVVFADSDPHTFTLTVEEVERRITEDTSALMLVHLYGHPCDMDGLLALAQKYKLRVIEDCAQAHGAEYQGKRVGALGDLGAFSFYPGKNLGAYGDGGAILSNDAALAKRCRMIANHGRVDKYKHEFEGRNSRLDGIQAAILDVKLRKLDAWIAARNDVAGRYNQGLAGIAELTLPIIQPGNRHAFHLYVVRTDKRDALASFLGESGVETGIHYPVALPQLAAYEYLGQSEEKMQAFADSHRLLSLPIGEHLSTADIDRTVSLIRSFFENKPQDRN